MNLLIGQNQALFFADLMYRDEVAASPDFNDGFGSKPGLVFAARETQLCHNHGGRFGDRRLGLLRQHNTKVKSYTSCWFPANRKEYFLLFVLPF